MEEQPCQLLNYVYRRRPMPGSVVWHMNCYTMSDRPVRRVPGFVEQDGTTDQLSILVAVPCSASGGIETATQDEYEDLAGEHFGQLRPGHELA
jgi:hypothetical protein